MTEYLFVNEEDPPVKVKFPQRVACPSKTITTSTVFMNRLFVPCNRPASQYNTVSSIELNHDTSNSTVQNYFLFGQHRDTERLRGQPIQKVERYLVTAHESIK